MRASLSRSDTVSHSEDAERTAAFRCLAQRTLDPCFRLAHAILGNPAEAEDAVQDAFVTAWRKWGKPPRQRQGRCLLQRIVVNSCRDRLRQRARRRTDDISLYGSLASPDPSAAVDRHVLLEQALGRLDADD